MFLYIVGSSITGLIDLGLFYNGPKGVLVRSFKLDILLFESILYQLVLCLQS